MTHHHLKPHHIREVRRHLQTLNYPTHLESTIERVLQAAIDTNVVEVQGSWASGYEAAGALAYEQGLEDGLSTDPESPVPPTSVPPSAA